MPGKARILLLCAATLLPSGIAAQERDLGNETRGALPERNEWPEPQQGSAAFEVPPVPDRPLGELAGPTTTVLGYRIQGVVEYPQLGITEAAVQAAADQAYRASVEGSPAIPERAQYPSAVYARFAALSSGDLVENPDQSLTDLVQDHAGLGRGPQPDLHGLSMSQLQRIDQTLDAIAADLAAGFPTSEQTVGELIDQLRAARSQFTIGQMQSVAAEVTAFYRAKGLFLAQAFIPAQLVGDDALVTIQVMEGKIGNIVVEGNAVYSQRTLGRIARRLQGRAVTKESIEATLLRTNDLPGIRVFGTFRPGENVGESDLVLQVLSEDRWQFETSLDNFGTEFTGEIRGRTEARWNNALGQADSISLSLVQSVAPANSSFARATLRLPLGARPLSVGLSASLNSFALDKDQFAVLDIAGDTTIVQGDLSWQMARSRFFNSTLAVSATAETSELSSDINQITLNDDQIGLVGLEAGLDHVDSRLNGINVLSATASAGERDFLDQFGQARSLDFSVYTVSYSRLQAMPFRHTLLLRLRGQFSADPLSSLEQFSLAGPDAVRAYPVSEVITDEGYFASLEYRIAGPRRPGPFGRSWSDLLRFDLFGDFASGSRNALDDGGSSPSTELSGVGLGLRFTVPQRFEAGLQLSAPLSKRPPSDMERRTTRPSDDGQSTVTVLEDATLSDIRVYAEFVAHY